MTRLLVTGGRNYAKRDEAAQQRAAAALDAIHEQHGVTLVMQGGATGADAIARAWAKVRNIASVTYEADWDRYGGRAGPMRNERMLNLGRPQLVVAFPGGRGTADMVARAKAAGVKILYVETR